MYDLLNDNAGRERHQAMLKEAAQERLARQAENDNGESLAHKLSALVDKATETVARSANSKQAGKSTLKNA